MGQQVDGTGAIGAGTSACEAAGAASHGLAPRPGAAGGVKSSEEAEQSFRRVKGCREMPVLVAALGRHAASVSYDEEPA